jgi:hypothetical protein
LSRGGPSPLREDPGEHVLLPVVHDAVPQCEALEHLQLVAVDQPVVGEHMQE